MEFFIFFYFFIFFENLILNIEISEITPFFYNIFSDSGYEKFSPLPFPPWLRPWPQLLFALEDDDWSRVYQLHFYLLAWSPDIPVLYIMPLSKDIYYYFKISSRRGWETLEMREWIPSKFWFLCIYSRHDVCIIILKYMASSTQCSADHGVMKKTLIRI